MPILYALATRRFEIIPTRVDSDPPESDKVTRYQWHTSSNESRPQRGLVLYAIAPICRLALTYARPVRALHLPGDASLHGHIPDNPES
jgi:hypothetical protein